MKPTRLNTYGWNRLKDGKVVSFVSEGYREQIQMLGNEIVIWYGGGMVRCQLPRFLMEIIADIIAREKEDQDA